MTEIRTLRDDERPRLAELLQNAYRFAPDYAIRAAERMPLEESLCISHEGRLGSFLRMIPYRVFAGGQPVPMGGISTVATWTDLQGRGHAGALMRRSLHVMRERGDVLSALYPFSHRFYRQFGWETSTGRIEYGPFTQAQVRRHDEFRLVRAVTSSAEWAACDEAYRAYASRYNGMVVRDQAIWDRHWDHHTNLRGQFYLVEQDGRPAGHAFLQTRDLPTGGCAVTMVDFSAATPDAERAIYGLLARLPTIVKEIMVFAPPSPDFSVHFLEPTVPQRRHPVFMMRVVDVEKAVALRGYTPEVRGGVRLAIDDPEAPWNSACWQVDVEAGKATARRTDGAPDASLSIQQFSRLYHGAMDPVREALHGGAIIGDRRTLAFLRDAFCDRPDFLIDPF